MSQTSHEAGMAGASEGFFPRLGAALFGARAKRLRERLGRAHWLSYLLIIAQSIAVVLVFGHADVAYLFDTSPLAIKAFALGALFLLVITVIAADLALVDTMLRIPALKRNRQAGALFEHRAYQFFVLVVEGVTYGVVIYALDSDPQALIQGRSLIPTAGGMFLALVVMRVLLISWSAVQLIIVNEKLPVLLSTLMNTGKEIVGGHLEEQLKALDVRHIEPHALMSVYGEMSRPPRPIAGTLNALTGGWIVKRALAQEAEEERQAQNVIAALQRIKTQQPTAAATHTLTTALDTPTSPALPAVNVESQRLSRHDARRAALAADMYGQRGHPTSPRGAAVSAEDYDADASESSGDEWSLGDLLASADDYGAFDDDGPEAFTSSNASNGHRRPASKRGSAARVASRGAELVVREFVMPDLPPSKYERDEDSDQRRAVFRVLDQDASISREELMRRAGVSDGTARLARSLWNERRSKRGQKRAAPRTTEMAAITPEMLASH